MIRARAFADGTNPRGIPKVGLTRSSVTEHGEAEALHPDFEASGGLIARKARNVCSFLNMDEVSEAGPHI
jgi:hypothetical protein